MARAHLFDSGGGVCWECCRPGEAREAAARHAGHPNDDPLDPAVCEDTENDGAGDGCDDCSNFNGNKDGFGTDPDNDPADDGLDVEGDGICDPDGDGDGLADKVDNCMTVENAGQENSDGDSY